MSYKIGPQKQKNGTFKLCVQAPNGKLYLSGEGVKNKKDMWDAFADFIGNVHDFGFTQTTFPINKKWPKNSGPAKKKAVKSTSKRK